MTTETVNQRRDCTTFPVRVIATPDPSDEGRMIVTVEDISNEVQRRGRSSGGLATSTWIARSSNIFSFKVLIEEFYEGFAHMDRFRIFGYS